MKKSPISRVKPTLVKFFRQKHYLIPQKDLVKIQLLLMTYDLDKGHRFM